jgi:predicted acetyltransferase
MSGAPVCLIVPSLAALPGYEAALAAGWSPSTTRDVSAEQLAALRRDPAAFLRDLTDQAGTVLVVAGRTVPRIPFRLFWIWDGEFCGRIDFRFLPGTEELPPHVSGHVGYTVVPWKQRRGYARQALRLLLPIARAEGFARIVITCDDDNEPSRKVIEAAGGILAGIGPNRDRPDRRKFLFTVETNCGARPLP